MLLDPWRNVVLADAYNGGPRGGDQLCGGNDRCIRDDIGIPSGTMLEQGCHHAEMNLIANCAERGVATKGMWVIITGEPCMICAKLLHHSGVETVMILEGRYSTKEGLRYLHENNVEVLLWRDGLAEPMFSPG